MTRTISSLSGEWSYRFDEGEWASIQVPGCWEAASGVLNFSGPVWYRTELALPELRAGQRSWLEFDGVSYACEVFLDGEQLGEHIGIWDGFRLLIPEDLAGKTVELLLRVEKPASLTAGPDSAYVPGKYPLRSTLAGFLPYVWGHMFGGIWQDVRLVCAGPGVIEAVRVRGSAHGRVHVQLRCDYGAELEIEIIDPDGLPVLRESHPSIGGLEAGSQAQKPYDANIEVHISKARCWRPDTPELYTLRLYTQGDEYEQRFGLRDLEAQGTDLVLNGQPIYPRMALSWGWYPDVLHSNPGAERIRAEFSKLKALGYNGVKLCLWVPPAEYFEIADELGMLLWLELPMWLPKPSDHFRQQLMAEYEALVRQTCDHPALIMYSLGCELNRAIGPELLEPLYAMTRALAGDVLVRDNSGSGEAYGGLLREHADYYDYHFYSDIHHFRHLLDHFAPRWRPVQPWVFGEFCDLDTFRGSGVGDQRSGIGDRGSGIGDRGSGNQASGNQGPGVGGRGLGVGERGAGDQGAGGGGRGAGDQGAGGRGGFFADRGGMRWVALTPRPPLPHAGEGEDRILGQPIAPLPHAGEGMGERDETIQGKKPTRVSQGAGAEEPQNIAAIQTPWWYSDDAQVNPQGARWQFELPFHEQRMRKNGLWERSAELEQLSYQHALLHRKWTIELVRCYREIGGYVITGEVDTPISTAGMWDDAGQLKFDPDDFRAFNADSVLCVGWDRRRDWVHGGDRAAYWDCWSYSSGTQVRAHLILAHYGEPGSVHVRWSVAYEDSPPFSTGEQHTEFRIASAEVREVALAEFMVPKLRRPGRAILRAEWSIGEQHGQNSWELCFFPDRPWADIAPLVYDPGGVLKGLERVAPTAIMTHDIRGQGVASPRGVATPRLVATPRPIHTIPVITTMWNDDIDAFVRDGGRAILLQQPDGPPGPLAVTHLPFWREALRVAEPHLAWGDFPHKGWADLAFYGCATDAALKTSDWEGPQHSILRRVDVRSMDVHDYAVELHYGAGRLIVSTLRFQGGHGDQPVGIGRNTAAIYLLGCWIRYLARLA